MSTAILPNVSPFDHDERDNRYSLERRVAAAKAAITDAQREYHDAREALRQHDSHASSTPSGELLEEISR